MRILLATMILALSPVAAVAYVDPGILGALFQMGYVALFGLLTVVFFRPWGYLKSKYRRLRGQGADTEDPVSREEVETKRQSDADE